MSVRIPITNGTCPCKACQAHIARTPAQRERRKHLKRIDHFVNQMARIKK